MIFAITNVGGAIDSLVSAPDQNTADEQCDGDQRAVAVDRTVSPKYDYIDPQTDEPRIRDITPMTLSAYEAPADGQSTIMLSDLAADTEIRIRGPENSTFTSAGGTEELVFVAPGQYEITATAPFPARPTRVTVDAT